MKKIILLRLISDQKRNLTRNVEKHLNISNTVNKLHSNYCFSYLTLRIT
jgi:hypothetical protein